MLTVREYASKHGLTEPENHRSLQRWEDYRSCKERQQMDDFGKGSRTDSFKKV